MLCFFNQSFGTISHNYHSPVFHNTMDKFLTHSNSYVLTIWFRVPGRIFTNVMAFQDLKNFQDLLKNCETFDRIISSLGVSLHPVCASDLWELGKSRHIFRNHLSNRLPLIQFATSVTLHWFNQWRKGKSLTHLLEPILQQTSTQCHPNATEIQNIARGETSQDITSFTE